jgi:hypothetical protein
MPPEQDNPRARQLEALRRYVSELADQVEHPPEVRGRRRPPSRWLLLTGLLVGLALVGGVLVGAVAWSDDRPSPAPRPGDGSLSSAQSTSTSVAAGSASPECKTAVDRANRSLAIAVKLRKALAEHTGIMDDLLDGRIDRAAAREARTPSELTGQLQSAKFDLALADYRKVVDQCRLQAP